MDPKGKLLKAGEEKRLLEAANPWMQRLIIAALETGMRRGELLKLQWRHVDLTRGHINIPAEITKTAEGRKVIMSARLRPVLEMVRTSPMTGEDHKAIAFVFGDPERNAVGSPKKAWETLVLRAHGIKPISDKVKKRLAPEARQQLAAIDCTGMTFVTGRLTLDRGRLADSSRATTARPTDLKETSTYLNTTVKGLEDLMRKI